MRKVYGAFVDCFKELATDMIVADKKHCKQNIRINGICEMILKADKVTKFIEIYEMLEDLSEFLHTKVCLVNNFFCEFF